MSAEFSHVSKSNRLPAEILSAIFVICESVWNADPHNIRKPYGCQLTLPAVCHMWRKIALDTTALWTRVTIVNDPPYTLLELFLSRSGTAPLDIAVYMNSSIEDYDDESAAETTAEEINTFLERHCSTSRWRTYRLEVNYFYAFYILGTWPFTDRSTFPSLQSLELISTASFCLDPHDTDLGDTLHNAFLEFSEPQAQLRSLKIRGLLSPYIFGTSFHKQLTSLVHLELHFSGKFEWYDHEPNTPATYLLSKDPTSSEVVEALNAPKVYMPMLSTLSFLAISSPIWVLDHLLTLDAPKLTTFELTFGRERLREINGGRKAIQQLAHYIATTGPVGGKRDPKPLFPSLTHMTFSCLEEYFEEDLEVLLAGYPQLSSLSLPRYSALRPLVKTVSELANLKVGVKDVTELKGVLVARREAGIALPSVQVVRSALKQPIEPSDLTELEEMVEFSLVDEEEMDNAD